MDLRSNRNKLRISQSRLSLLAGVSRFKICLYELHEGTLTAEEQSLIRRALQAEASRLQNVRSEIDFGQSEAPSVATEVA